MAKLSLRPGSRFRADGQITAEQVEIRFASLISGPGTINGKTLDNLSGFVGPGQSPGTLEFTGDYNQFADAALEIELGGLAAGDQYDRFVVGRTASFLEGTKIDVTLVDLDDPEANLHPFMPAAGDTFDVLVADGIAVPEPKDLAGLFDFPELTGGLFFEPAVVPLEDGRQAMRLTVQVPQPSSILLLATAILALAVRRGRKRVRSLVTDAALGRP